MNRRPAAGITLVELLVVLAIVAILASSSLYGYRGYVQRVNRIDASSALLRIASAQERHLMQHQQYAVKLADGPPDGLGLAARSERGLYRLRLETGSGPLEFRALAEVDPAGPQRHDRDCWVLELDHRGQRRAGALGQGISRDPAARCWGY